jgi:CRP-like cAMP-binding protein
VAAFPFAASCLDLLSRVWRILSSIQSHATINLSNSSRFVGGLRLLEIGSEVSNMKVNENIILSSLPQDEYRRLLPQLETMDLPLGRSLYKSGDIIQHVYFPLSALVSLVTHMTSGGAIEVAVIGKDGMVGIPVLLGDEIAFEEAVVQVPGQALRMRSNILKEIVQERHSPLLTSLLLYTRNLMKQVMQTAACNRLHNETERLARWLLLCRDRAESDNLILTQDFLSDILGLPRETVTQAATLIQTNGLIRYSPGSIKILQRKKLEELACECYRIEVSSHRNSGVMLETKVSRSTVA